MEIHVFCNPCAGTLTRACVSVNAPLMLLLLVLLCVCILMTSADIVAFRARKLDCFRAGIYHIADRAHYRLKPEDQLISLDTNTRLDKPGVLHTVLHQRGILPVNSCNWNQEKRTVTCNGTVASGVMTMESKRRASVTSRRQKTTRHAGRVQSHPANKHGEIVDERTKITAVNVSSTAWWQTACWTGLYLVNCRHYVAGEMPCQHVSFSLFRRLIFKFFIGICTVGLSICPQIVFLIWTKFGM